MLHDPITPTLFEQEERFDARSAPRTRRRVLSIVCALSVVCLALLGSMAFFSRPVAHAATAPLSSNTSFRGRIGGEVSDLEFVDAMKNTSPWQLTDGTGNSAPLDANGWPTSDAYSVIFDQRPCCPFFPPGVAGGPNRDDPENYQLNVSGTYHLSFTGQAVVSPWPNDPAGVGAFTVSNQAYNAATNTTTADINVLSGHVTVEMEFTQTKRLPTDQAGTGLTNIKLLLPGYPATTNQTFTQRFIASLSPYSVLRFMGDTNTNDNGGIPNFFATPNLISWSNRHLPTDATQQTYGSKDGLSWEYVIQIANAAHKDIWLNAPLATDTSYLTKLAQLFKYGSDLSGNPYTSRQRHPVYAPLDDDLKIYIEDSNELWNGTFPQYLYNIQAAGVEVAAGGSNLNNDGSTDQTAWAARRHARRLIDVDNAFASVFGSGSINTKIRPVLSWFVLFPDQYQGILTWVQNTYGNPNKFFYAIAGTAYARFDNVAADASVDDLLAAAYQSSADNAVDTVQLAAIAQQYHLKYDAYEGEIENLFNGQQTLDDIINRVRAVRDPRIEDFLVHHMKDNFFDKGGDLFMYFTAKGNDQRFGYYGATEDYNNLQTPQLQAIYALQGLVPPNNPASDPRPFDGITLPRYGGGGLTGVYYNTNDLSGAVAGVRTDAYVNFNPGSQPLAYLINASGSSARWIGQVQAPRDGRYTFSITADGSVRLWINNVKVIDDWSARSAPSTDTSKPIRLNGGQKYQIQLEYAQGSGNAVVQLKWASGDLASQVIPQHFLYPTGTALDQGNWSASASNHSQEARRAIDENPNSLWSTGTAQAAGQYFQVDMGSQRTFQALSLNSLSDPANVASAYTVSVSNDGVTWQQVATGQSFTATTTTTFAQQTARYVRVTLTAAASHPWSMNDFNLYDDNNNYIFSSPA